MLSMCYTTQVHPQQGYVFTSFTKTLSSHLKEVNPFNSKLSIISADFIIHTGDLTLKTVISHFISSLITLFSTLSHSFLQSFLKQNTESQHYFILSPSKPSAPYTYSQHLAKQTEISEENFPTFLLLYLLTSMVILCLTSNQQHACHCSLFFICEHCFRIFHYPIKFLLFIHSQVTSYNFSSTLYPLILHQLLLLFSTLFYKVNIARVFYNIFSCLTYFF